MDNPVLEKDGKAADDSRMCNPLQTLTNERRRVYDIDYIAWAEARRPAPEPDVGGEI
jgi:hypothetical protein